MLGENEFSAGRMPGPLSSVGAYGTFLEKWYRCWDDVFLKKQNPDVCQKLGSFLSQADCTIHLPSKTLRSREELTDFSRELQATDIQDTHKLEGLIILGTNRVEARVAFQRTAPVSFSVHARIEIEFVTESGELKIKSYHPHFSSQEVPIRQMMGKYLESFQSMTSTDVLPYYAVPVALVSPRGLASFQAEAEVLSFLERVFSELKAKNYAKSIWREMNVFVFSDSMAMVSAVFDRLDRDERLIERSGALYHLVFQGGSWRIAVGQAVGEGQVLR